MENKRMSLLKQFVGAYVALASDLVCYSAVFERQGMMIMFR